MPGLHTLSTGLSLKQGTSDGRPDFEICRVIAHPPDSCRQLQCGRLPGHRARGREPRRRSASTRGRAPSSGARAILESHRTGPESLPAGCPTAVRQQSKRLIEPVRDAHNHSCCKNNNTGQSGRPANPEATLEQLVDVLMEPVGRQARRRAARAIRKADR